MKNLIRTSVIRTWQFLRASCLILGMTVALLLIIESCYRVQRSVRDAVRESKRRPGVADPRLSLDWFAGYSDDYNATRLHHWKPYVYFGRFAPYHGRYINIDTAGFRVTPQPSTPATPLARVFFFGGSTTWGTSLRDDHTIPAEASRRLQTLAGPGARIEVSNYAENGYVSTQGVLQLMLQLRAGKRPDVVVFVDGINDVFATVQAGEGGLPQNESKRVSEFAMGRVLDKSGVLPGLGPDLRAFGVLAGKAAEQFAIVGWVESLRKPPAVPLVAADLGARETARAYAENARFVEALAVMYGFTAIYVWQPSLHGTTKVLTPYEAQIMRGIKGDPVERRMQEVHLAVPALLDSSMAAVAKGRFVDEASLFAGDSMAVFVDRIGHNTEESIPRIVDAFWPVLQKAVTQRRTVGR